jgi:hypothetical protein
MKKLYKKNNYSSINKGKNIHVIARISEDKSIFQLSILWHIKNSKRSFIKFMPRSTNSS